MKTREIFIDFRYSLFERFFRAIARASALAFLAYYDPRFIPFIVICVALHVISKRPDLD